MSYSPDEAQTPIHVALAVYDPKGTYSQHAGVVMASIFENTKSPVVVHILHDETLTEDNRKKFIRTAEKYGQTVDLIDTRKYMFNLNGDAIALAKNSRWTIGTLYRLFIPNLLDLDRVIYLDCDVIVNLDILELWNIDLEGNCLGGVFDNISKLSKWSYNAICEKLNRCPMLSYINAGVLLMNLTEIRKRGNLFQLSMAYYSLHRHSMPYLDQDILNAIFSDSIKLIDPKFNYFLYSRDPKKQHDDFNGCITHLTLPKPWRELTGLATERLYWSMFLRSAWGEKTTVDELIGILGRVASLSPQIHRHTKQCYQQIGIRLFRDIFHPELFATIWLLLQELYARIRRSIFAKNRS